MNQSAVPLRTQVRLGDARAVRDIVTSTGFFSPGEIAIAVELIHDRIEHGEGSHYQFIFADDSGGEPLAYVCFGRICGTQASFDLYWIAVREEHRGKGIGRVLMREAECRILDEGGPGARIYVETSSRRQYEPTRQFYIRGGYAVVSTLDDFYAPGDGKVTLVKVV